MESEISEAEKEGPQRSMPPDSQEPVSGLMPLIEESGSELEQGTNQSEQYPVEAQAK